MSASETNLGAETALDPLVIAEITLNEAHYREHHNEWTSIALPNMRAMRQAANLLGMISGAIFLWAAIHWDFKIFFLGLFVGYSAYQEGRTFWRRRMEWLRFIQKRPHYGQHLRIALLGRVLLQVKDFPGDPGFAREVIEHPTLGQVDRVVRSPHGYFLRYRACQALVDAPEVAERNSGSLYIPRRAIKTPPGPEEFERTVGVCDWIEEQPESSVDLLGEMPPESKGNAPLLPGPQYDKSGPTRR